VNTPSTAPPSGRQSLDHFETALLGELKEHVATQPARAPLAERPHRRRRRWAAGSAAAAAAATAYVVVSPGGPAVSPAYAVDQQSDGDIVVTIHRLEDSDGLEAALRDLGIDADVNYDPGTTENGITTFEMKDPDVDDEDAPPGGTTDERGPSTGAEQRLEVDQAIPGEVPTLPDCGWDEGDPEPATLTHERDDWVLRIPAKSPLQDRPVSITTGSQGELGVAYEGNDPGSYCAVLSSGG
jgi:hypothetical protein